MSLSFRWFCHLTREWKRTTIHPEERLKVTNMNEIIMMVMAAGALLGGLDRIIGNKFGLGEKFEEGFRLVGSLALSICGIICLAPVLADLLSGIVTPLFTAIGVDPGMFGSVLSIDMGGYPLATELALDAGVGSFSGIVAASIFGCTLVFTIPVGLGATPREEMASFEKGLTYGLIIMPVALVIGGLLSGMGLLGTVWQCMPIFVISGLLLLCMVKWMEKLLKGFGVFARCIEIVSTVGLVLGAVEYMTGMTILPGITPLKEAMGVACSIGIVMLGSLPMAELLKVILKKPFRWFGEKTGMNSASTTGLILGIVSGSACLVMVKDMDRRGIIVNAASLVCGCSCLAAHLGYTVSVEPNMVGALLASKLLGALLGAVVAVLATSRKKISV